MKRFLFGFILGITLSAVHAVKAQEAPAIIMRCGDNGATCATTVDAPPHAIEHDLTVREIVEILSEVDVRHGPQQPFFPPSFGATNFAVDPAVIWIFSTGRMAERRSTVFHELLHTWCHNEGLNCSEAWVDAEENRQYQKSFGDE